ncbi:MAG TPA: Gldg family protein [Stellaceae bacterium]|nr:Gldg family protein [Stellaceae bacterium]
MRPFSSRGGRSLLALAAIALLLVASNIIVGRYGALRLDLTSEHLYTLAKGTRQTLTKIQEPITLRLYYSNRLGESAPSYGVYAQRLRELLDQYVAAAKGKLRLEVYDPVPFSDAEDRAVAFGLQAVPLNDQGEAIYFGLAGTNSTDDQQVIAFFHPERERFLEYDLTRLVHALANPKRTVVGLMSSLPLVVDPTAALQGKAPEPLAIISQLRQVDDVVNLSPDIDAIPKNVDVLMLVHPQHLSDATLFAIDQFVLKGGKAIVFIDPYSEIQAAVASTHGDAAAPDPPASNLEPLFKAWGVTMLPGVVAGDRLSARRVAVPVEGRGPQALDYVGWLDLPKANLSRDDPITADLSQIALATAGILEPINGAKTQFTPLMTTSTDSEKIPVDQVKGLPDVATLLAHFRPEQRSFVLAAHITGDIATAFPDGKPEGAADAAQPGLKESAQPANIVIVADTDMLDDRFWSQTQNFYGRRVVQPIANNSDFLDNAIEVLAGGEDLVDLRGRGTVARPFVVVERLQREADERYAAEQKNLQDKLKQTQAKLHSLTTGEGGSANASAVTADQTKEIDRFRADVVATRQQLRQVQGALRQDIERLKVILEFFDIALAPIIVVVAAVVMAAVAPTPAARGPRLRRNECSGVPFSS